MRLFRKREREIERRIQEQDDRDVQWLKDRVAEMEATTGEHSCKHCTMASDYHGKMGTFHCIHSFDLIVGATGDKDVVYRRWNQCDRFSPRRECRFCEHYDREALTGYLADGAAVSMLPEDSCRDYSPRDDLTKIYRFDLLSCACRCKNFKYREAKE